MVAALAGATPAHRDRVVDAVRAFAIAVVVLWHWVGSLTHRAPDGTVVMPNPIAEVPYGWLATWVLQVVPAFFVVGGYANLAGWRADGGRTSTFLRRRARRLGGPVAVWVGLWLLAETVATITVPGHRWLGAWFPGVLGPLWFLLTYVVITALVPLTARAHEHHGRLVVVALTAALVVSEVLSRGFDVSVATWASVALVWVLVHQLGYFWRDHGPRPRAGAALAALGVAVLAGLTSVGGYPRSMVAELGGESNMMPSNATIVALALIQLGLIWMLSPVAARVLQRGWAWRPVVALNTVALTVFVWHMTAFAAVFLAAERLGVGFDVTATPTWVLTRPLWLLAAGVVLLALIAVFGRVEHGAVSRRAAR